jgi:hypothetical protein
MWVRWFGGFNAYGHAKALAKNRFGSICALAKREPVFVEKAGQIDTVIMSADQYRALQANQNNSSLASRKTASAFAHWLTT